MAARLTSSPPAAPKSAIATPACWVTAPQRTLPAAMPPCKIKRYRDNARALIDDGTALCVATLKEVINVIHAMPPTINIMHNNPKWRTSAKAAVAAANVTVAVPTSVFVEKWFRNFGRTMVPITEPMPKKLKRVPYPKQSSSSSWYASNGSKAHMALANGTKTPVRTSTARRAGVCVA